MATETLPAYVMWYGTDRPPDEQRLLRAGPLVVTLDGLDLRYIRLEGREIVRRVYVAVRDPNWHTIPAVYTGVRVDASADAFDISFDARHRSGEIDFAWHGTIQGMADGTISYRMDGEALRTFQKNRIGFCILHPMDCAGVSCRVVHPDGTVEEGTFPTYISPHQPFLDIAAIAHDVERGAQAEVRLEGDIFEMEDQRNWTDASFKTYSTPLRLPYPVEIAQGTRVVQTCVLSLRGTVPTVSARSDDAGCWIAVDPTRTQVLPRLGLGLASHGQPLSPRETMFLRALRPAHLRVDLDLTAPTYEAVLVQGTEQGHALGAPLELALFVSDEFERELAALEPALRRHRPDVARWLVFHTQEPVTPPETVDAARRVLGAYRPGVPVGGGTNAYFVQLNRNRPPRGALDVMSYSINPQVHAFDNASLAETLGAQAVTLTSARQFGGDTPLAISPVTLRPRFNPDATVPEPAPAPGTLPPQVDPRQMSLFGAGWTAGSIASLAQGGAHSVTYYETTGWRGVMETEAGSPLPHLFHAAPGMVFPLYHVLADAAEFADAVVCTCKASHPLRVDALALADGRRVRLLAANMTAAPQAVTVHLPGLRAVRVRYLDEHSFTRATTDPEGFRREEGDALAVDEGSVHLTLQPYAVARLDGESGG